LDSNTDRGDIVDQQEGGEEKDKIDLQAAKETNVLA
jgi:hypothetical protein